MIVCRLVVTIDQNQSEILRKLRVKTILKGRYYIAFVLGFIELLLVFEVWHA